MGDCAPCELETQLSMLDVRTHGAWPAPSESEAIRLKEDVLLKDAVLFSFDGLSCMGRLSGAPKMQYMTSRN
jgi:hypothetical protein